MADGNRVGVTPAPVILVAEDNDDDFVLLRCALESAGLPHRLIGVLNGVDALNYLCANEPFANRSAYPFPDLVLLDLDMPVMDGFEVLAQLKEQSQFRYLPIVIMSAIDDPLVIQQVLNAGAKDYLIKPVTMDERIGMIRTLHWRWLKSARGPGTGERNNNTLSISPPESIRDPKNSS